MVPPCQMRREEGHGRYRQQASLESPIEDLEFRGGARRLYSAGRGAMRVAELSNAILKQGGEAGFFRHAAAVHFLQMPENGDCPAALFLRERFQ
jgi:hypothetical protein